MRFSLDSLADKSAFVVHENRKNYNFSFFYWYVIGVITIMWMDLKQNRRESEEQEN